MTMKIRNIAAIIILAIGSLQMAGYITGSKVMRGIGLASGVAPFPKVFCEADGYEAFAAGFTVEGTLEGKSWSRRLDPRWYSDLRGPYNRRNVYGAALAFAPRLPEALRQSLLNEALSPGSTLRQELGIPENITDLRILITPREGETHGPWTYQIKAP